MLIAERLSTRQLILQRRPRSQLAFVYNYYIGVRCAYGQVRYAKGEGKDGTREHCEE